MAKARELGGRPRRGKLGATGVPPMMKTFRSKKFVLNKLWKLELMFLVQVGVRSDQVGVKEVTVR